MSHNVNALTKNRRAEKHAGASAVKAIQKGLPFNEKAAIVQDELERELDVSGVYEFVKVRMLRLATAEQFYWNAANLAAECGDVEKYEGRIKTWGWLINSELRAIEQLDKIGTRNKGGKLAEVLEAYISQGQLQLDLPDVAKYDAGNDQEDQGVTDEPAGG